MAKSKNGKRRDKGNNIEQAVKEKKGNHGIIHFSWNFPEFGTSWQNKSWYRWAIIAAIILLIYAFFTANYLFAVIIILVTIIYFFQSFDSPLTVTCEIAEDGITIGRRFYDYRDLSLFWIIYEPPDVKALYVEFKNPVKPRLGIPLQDQNPLHIRETLKQYLSEDFERENEPLSDGLSRVFKMHH